MQTNQDGFGKALKLLGLVGASLLTAIPAVQAAEGEEDVERIEVTGSRIKRIYFEGATPITSIGQEEIKGSGVPDLGTLLQQLTSSGSELNTTFNNGGDGSTRVGLRNLGALRTLVLLNGRRFVNGGAGGANGSVDINTIPMAMVEKVEVFKDGASAVYGSDAIAGVINIITKKDYEGLNLEAFHSRTDENDGQVNEVNATVGFTGDRGSVLFGFSWFNQDEINASDRGFSNFVLNGGSIATPEGVFRTTAGDFLTRLDGIGPSDNPNLADYRLLDTSTDLFNFTNFNFLATPQERRSIFAQGRYDLNDHVTVFAEGSYTNRTSQQEIAPTPLFLNDSSGIRVDAANRFNPFGESLGAGEDGTFLARRFIEGGTRTFDQTVDTYRLLVGAEGDFFGVELLDGWTWDLAYGWGQNEGTEVKRGELLKDNLLLALGPDAACTADPECVALNLFGGEGSITQEMIDFVTFTGVAQGTNEIKNFVFNVTGDLFELPAGPVGVAFGYEFREERGETIPDPETQRGNTTGNAQQITAGAFDVHEAYMELLIPLVSDVFLVDSLELEYAIRHSHYNTFGTTNNNKVSLIYRPISDVLLRGTWAEGFRAPSISQLFGGVSDSFPTFSDPCSDFNNPDIAIPDGSSLATLIANCVASGVPADGSFDSINGQVRSNVGGNTDLDPEESESYTFGIVWSPEYIEGLFVSVDFYSIEITDTLTTLGAQFIANECFFFGRLCDRVGPRDGIAEITVIDDTVTNIGETEVRGVDYFVRYTRDTEEYGSFAISVDAAYLDKFEETIGAETRSLAGIFDGDNDTNYTRWRINTNLTWNIEDWNFGYTLRFRDSVLEQGGDVELIEGDGTEIRRIEYVFYHDIQAGYSFGEVPLIDGATATVTFGVENLFDEQPPLSGTAFANNYDVTTYDHSRVIYARLGVQL